MRKKANPISRMFAAWGLTRREKIDNPPAEAQAPAEVPWAMHMGIVAGIVRDEFALKKLVEQLAKRTREEESAEATPTSTARR